MNTETGTFEPVEIKQTRGPTLSFQGKLLASEQFTSKGREPMEVTLEVWETPAGAWIAASYASPVEREGFEDARAVVVKPGDWGKDAAAPSNVQEMQFAVMDFFQWEHRARSMMRKQAKWSFKQEIA